MICIFIWLVLLLLLLHWFNGLWLVFFAGITLLLIKAHKREHLETAGASFSGQMPFQLPSIQCWRALSVGWQEGLLACYSRRFILPPPRRICNRRSLSVCLFVCLLAALRKNFQTDLHEIFREGLQWASEQMIKFWWRSRSRIRIHITTLVRRALVEVCTVPVLLVNI